MAVIAKELIDARWKAIIGAALGLISIIAGAVGYDMMKSALTQQQLDSLAGTFGGDFASRLSNYGAFIWAQTFNIAGNNGVIIMIVAALIGSSLIAGEVGKGTIFLLLSRPLSRDRILLTKYGVGVVVLLGMNALAGVVLAVVAALAGHPQDLGGIAISVLLFWLGATFVLGLSTFFSLFFSDVLRPIALTLAAVILMSLPGLFPKGADWVLPSYWASLPAFLGQEFPTKALIISIVAAVVPILVAVPIFRRQAY